MALLLRQRILQFEERRTQRFDSHDVVFRDQDEIMLVPVDGAAQRRHPGAGTAEADETPIDRSFERIGAARREISEAWRNEQVSDVGGLGSRRGAGHQQQEAAVGVLQLTAAADDGDDDRLHAAQQVGNRHRRRLRRTGPRIGERCLSGCSFAAVRAHFARLSSCRVPSVGSPVRGREESASTRSSPIIRSLKHPACSGHLLPDAASNVKGARCVPCLASTSPLIGSPLR